MCIDEFNGDNFDHGKLGFVGGGYIGAVQTNGRPILGTRTPKGTPAWGAQWKQAVADNYLSSYETVTHGSSYSYRDCFLDLDPTYTDAYGSKLLRITFDFHENELKMSQYLTDRLAEITQRMGPRSLEKHPRTGPYDIAKYQTTHTCGGAIMGTDPKTSALNRYLQSWDVPEPVRHRRHGIPAERRLQSRPTPSARSPSGPRDAIRNQYPEKTRPPGASMKRNARYHSPSPRGRELGGGGRTARILTFLTFLALPLAPTHAQQNDKQDFALIARGRYLATVGDCTACHTVPGGAFLAGGRALPTPFGNLVSPNITPDQATGIGDMSDETFYNAMHNGMTHERLYPAMPYPAYTKATRSDVMAIRAWLNTIPPVVNKVHSNTLPFPFNIRLTMFGWNKLFFTPGEWHDQPDKSAEWNRGAYLVEGLGHCGTCHTPKNMVGADDNARHLQGYALQDWFAPDITGDKRVGVGAWSTDDIVEYLKTGANRYTSASGPMAEEISDSTSHWSLGDLHAAATYLLDQPGPNKPAPQPLSANDPVMRAGEAIYVDECSACHTMDGSGIARLLPTLKGSPFVQQDNPGSLLHVGPEWYTRRVHRRHADRARDAELRLEAVGRTGRRGGHLHPQHVGQRGASGDRRPGAHHAQRIEAFPRRLLTRQAAEKSGASYPPIHRV